MSVPFFFAADLLTILCEKPIDCFFERFQIGQLGIARKFLGSLVCDWIRISVTVGKFSCGVLACSFSLCSFDFGFHSLQFQLGLCISLVFLTVFIFVQLIVLIEVTRLGSSLENRSRNDSNLLSKGGCFFFLARFDQNEKRGNI